MSTPIKPPGGPTSGVDESVEGAEGGRVDGSDSGVEFQREVEGAGAARAGSGDPTAAVSPRIEALSAELEAGRIDADAAVDRLVDRALATAQGLPEADRRALESQLRAALAEDPTLIALRKDLTRASKT